MSDKKIVIAGAGGYLASNVMPFLKCMEGVELYALSSRETVHPTAGANVKHLKVNMNDYDKVKEIIADRCDLAVNFSWIGARGENQDEDAVQKANEENSVNLMKSLIEAGCSRFIQIGSMAEYGVVEGMITESSECHPITAYAKRKLDCANRMRDICDAAGIDFLEFRMGSMYGNYMGQENILGYLCRELVRKQHVKLKASCTQDWEYTHVDDFGEILCMAISSGIPSGIYNITNGETHKLRHFIHILAEKYGLSDHVEFGNIDQGIGCQNIRCDISKVRKHFNKNDFISFDKGIDSVISGLGNELRF